MTPLLLGHRGARASRHLPENTLASFELCLQHGCDGFEFDVRRSADGQAVVCHDPVSQEMKIAETPASALALPRLGEVLASFGARAFLDIELKVAGLGQETVGLLRQHPPQKGHVISSFLPEVLVELRRLDPDIPLGFLFDSGREIERWRALPVEWVIPHVELADREFIQKAHAAGKKVMVWTVNRADTMRKLAEWGADSIITDETERSAQVLAGV